MLLFPEVRSARSPRRRTEDKKPAAYKSSPLMRRARQKQRSLRLRRRRIEKNQMPNDDDDNVEVHIEEGEEEWTVVVSPVQQPAAPHAIRRVWTFLTSLFYSSKH